MRGSRWSFSALLGVLVMLGLAASASAATPSSGTIGATAQTASWQGQHYAAAASTTRLCPPAALDPDNRLCDHFALTVALDPSFWADRTGGALVTISWPSAEDDFTLSVFDSGGNQVAGSFQSGTTSEQVLIPNAAGSYEVRVVPASVVDSGYEGVASLQVSASCPKPAAAYDTGGLPGAGFPNDPLYPRQWGLRQIDAPGAWAQGALGRGATIAVIDTGVDLQHPDLKRKISGGADLTEGGPDQLKDCPRGPQDEYGHGTHTAGVAAANTDNGIGVAGVAPLAKLMPFRIQGDDFSITTEAAVLAIRRAAEEGADVINLSFGTNDPLDPGPEFEAAVDYAWSLGAVVVGAAGNSTFPLCHSPASSTRAVCVGATDRRGLPTYYSNFPNDLDGTVALRAPGGALGPGCEDDEDIWSTVLQGGIWDATCDDSLSPNVIRGYGTSAGTSFAAPHVAGVAALLAGRGLSNSEIVECLRTTSSNRGQFDPVMGYGIVNAAAAVREC